MNPANPAKSFHHHQPSCQLRMTITPAAYNANRQLPLRCGMRESFIGHVSEGVAQAPAVRHTARVNHPVREGVE